MRSFVTLAAASCLAGIASAGDPDKPNVVAGKLPVLGWNSWNAYGCDVDEQKIMSAAQAFLDLGLKDAGYQYVNIDDCWSVKSGRDPKTNRLQPNLSAFPDGINGTAAKVHGLGLLIGIYSSAGTKTCAGYPASLGYEEIDAQTWDEWGIDYLKYDNCNVPANWTDSCVACDQSNPNAANGTCTKTGPDGIKLCPSGYNYGMSLTARRYQDMQDALNTTKRNILYSLCEWGQQEVWTWGNQTAQSWRTTSDIQANWPSILAKINQNSFYLDYTDFWGHGDPDMLEVGNGGMTAAQYRTHFALWAAMKGPLLIGTDITKLSSDLVALLKNKYLLSFHQDGLVGRPAKPYKWGTNPDWTFDPAHPPEYWSGPSSNGTLVLLFNNAAKNNSMMADYCLIPELKDTKKYNIVDVWSGKNLGCHASPYQTTVGANDTAAFMFYDTC